MLTFSLQMHRTVPRRTGFPLSNFRWPLLLDFPTFVSKIPKNPLLHKCLDVVDRQLDYYIIRQLRFRQLDRRCCGNVPSRVRDDKLATAINLLRTSDFHSLDLRTRKQILANGGHNLCCFYRHQHSHHLDRNIHKSRCRTPFCLLRSLSLRQILLWLWGFYFFHRALACRVLFLGFGDDCFDG